MLSFFPRDVLDEIWDLIEPVSEGFPSYFCLFFFVAFSFFFFFFFFFFGGGGGGVNGHGSFNRAVNERGALVSCLSMCLLQEGGGSSFLV